ncbi:hypothetical protein J2S05_000805 [Alkalicoccobacillus murimartini]|uniref:Uncharacterized protein n=1 Tax=Alkalicoccobacillus murimartini TaxID=171685 RepID=A0ABT9YDV8_9BACI|nr:hypothetical protein [Alkalicoccobacillus murimartini]
MTNKMIACVYVVIVMITVSSGIYHFYVNPIQTNTFRTIGFINVIVVSGLMITLYKNINKQNS